MKPHVPQRTMHMHEHAVTATAVPNVTACSCAPAVSLSAVLVLSPSSFSGLDIVETCLPTWGAAAAMELADPQPKDCSRSRVVGPAPRQGFVISGSSEICDEKKSLSKTKMFFYQPHRAPQPLVVGPNIFSHIRGLEVQGGGGGAYIFLDDLGVFFCGCCLLLL